MTPHDSWRRRPATLVTLVPIVALALASARASAADWPDFSPVTLAEPGDPPSADQYATAWIDGQSSIASQAGTAIVTGDLDDDGVLDLVIGAPFYQEGGPARGAVFVYYGIETGLKGDESSGRVTIHGASNAYGVFGTSLAVADVTGDGTDDLVVGAPGENDDDGVVYILPGGAQWDSDIVIAVPGVIAIPGVVTGGQAGYAVAAGDVGRGSDAGGVADILIGAPGGGQSDNSVYLLYGPVNDGTAIDSGVVFHDDSGGSGRDTDLGAAVAVLGDLNGDGINDIGMGAPRALGDGEGGKAILLAGRNASAFNDSPYNIPYMSDASDKRVIEQGNVYDNGIRVGHLGAALAGIGDVDGDGYDDVALGAPASPMVSNYSGDATRLEAGRIYIYFGGSTSLNTATKSVGNEKYFYGETQNSHLGAAVHGAGDVDGDGYDDFLVGAPDWATSSPHTVSMGAAYLVAGRPPEDWPASGYQINTLPNATFRGYDSGDLTGTGLWGAPGLDLDEDGIGDFFIGAPGYDVGSGRVWYIALEDFYDLDGDGQSPAGGDCDDTDPAAYYGATEVCDGVDNDCDTLVDDDDDPVEGQNTYYRDADSDGYGKTPHFTCASSPPSGYVTQGGDCNDGNSTINPSAQEVCDGIDNDCDGKVDDADPSVTGQQTYFRDDDGDGYGLSNDFTVSCDEPSGYAAQPGDCDDTRAAINPGAEEVCDGIDNDCDDKVDDNDPSVVDQNHYYFDSDSDGYGDEATVINTCDDTPPEDTVETGGDCNDDDPAINPGAQEVCDGVDNDCDQKTDDADSSVTGQNTYYGDNDGDGHGSAASGNTQTCSSSPPSGYAASKDDCDDGNADVYPGAQEVCDGIDNDCDGKTDDEDPSVTGQNTYYRDNDGDGYGSATSGKQKTCADSPPSGFAATSDDCNDTNGAINPGAQEVCDGIDNDCDADVDDDDGSVVGQNTYYKDKDGDGYGDPNDEVLTCSDTPPSGTVRNQDDCNDTASSIYPGAPEGATTDPSRDCLVGDGLDNDCDPDTPTDVGTCGYDDDGDGQTEYAGDCDDTDPSSYLGAPEQCDNTDHDCDGDPTNGFDLDGDGHLSETNCSALGGDDCQDNDPDVYAGAVEVCDGKDNDCDGETDEGFDLDGDGYLSLATCPALGSDCDDTNPSIHPDATEVCDGVDQDCDGEPDNGFDDDHDGYVDETRCEGFCAGGGCDCDDTDAAVNPGALEVCDGIDNNCQNGTEDELADLDGDSYSVCNASDPSLQDCNDTDADIYPGAPELCDGADNDCDGAPGTDEVDNDADGFMVCDGDCDDTIQAVNPDQIEVCDYLDNDCNGEVDDVSDIDPAVSGAGTWYEDQDGDGHGAGEPVYSCTQVNGYVEDVDDDCDDTDPNTYAGAQELCDGVDNNCDLKPDEGELAFDRDGDGYLDAAQCGAYEGVELDCDDTNPAINPAAPETPGDGVDNNCDGVLAPDGSEFEDSGLGCDTGAGSPLSSVLPWWVLGLGLGLKTVRRRTRRT